MLYNKVVDNKNETQPMHNKISKVREGNVVSSWTVVKSI